MGRSARAAAERRGLQCHTGICHIIAQAVTEQSALRTFLPPHYHILPRPDSVFYGYGRYLIVPPREAACATA